MQAEKRRAKLEHIRALKQKEGAPKLLAALPLDEEPEKELAPVARNSICWGIFMATSANLRYQLLSGFDERYMVRCLDCMTLRPCYLLADALHGGLQRIGEDIALPSHPPKRLHGHQICFTS